MSGKLPYYILFWGFLLAGIVAQSPAEILNPGFEFVDPNGQGEQIKYFPHDWIRLNNGQAVQVLENPDPGRLDWSFGGEPNLMPCEGSYMALLDCVDISHTNSSQLRQIIEILPNDRICGAYFFGSMDYFHFIDYGRIYLEPYGDNPSPELVLAEIDLYDVGAYGSTDGWQRFCKIVPPQCQGLFTFVIEVANDYDDRFPSYLAVDDLSLCPNGTESDLNYDCITDNLDYQILTEYWTCDCSDPNDLPDPNVCPWMWDQQEVKVLFRGDITGDKAIGLPDLVELLRNWVTIF